MRVNDLAPLAAVSRAGYDAPRRAVPVLNQRLPNVTTGAVIPVAHGPHVARGDSCHGTQPTVICVADIGAGHNAPRRAVPVLDQCLKEVGGRKVVVAYGPYVARRDHRHTAERIEVRVTIVGAGHNAPRCAVP